MNKVYYLNSKGIRSLVILAEKLDILKNSDNGFEVDIHRIRMRLWYLKKVFGLKISVRKKLKSYLTRVYPFTLVRLN